MRGIEVLLFFDAYPFDLSAKHREKARKAQQNHTARQNEHGLFCHKTDPCPKRARKHQPQHDRRADHAREFASAKIEPCAAATVDT